MTEERMLRITEDDLNVIEGHGRFSGMTTIELYYEVDFYTLEPAPPKDCPYSSKDAKNILLCMHSDAYDWIDGTDDCKCIHEGQDWWNCPVHTRWKDESR